MARAAYLRECSGLSFGPSLRVKPPPRRGEWAQSRSPHFARAGGSRTLDLHRREPNRSPSDNLVAFPEGPTAPQEPTGALRPPVKTSPETFPMHDPQRCGAGRRSLGARCALGRRDKSYGFTRFITWQVATIERVGLVPLWA